MSIHPNYKPKKIAFLHTHLHTHLHTQYKKSGVFYHFAGSVMRVVIGVVTTCIRHLLYTQSYKQKRPVFRAVGVFLGYNNSPNGS